MSQSHPSLLRPTLFAVTWQVCTWLGWGIVAVSVLSLSRDDILAMGAPLVMIVAVVLLSELRPIVMTRLVGNPVSISLAFVFAAMYLWGLYPAVLLYAVSILLSEMLQRKAAWKWLFNVGQFTVSLAAAWLVLYVGGIAASPTSPHTDMTISDLFWVIGSWVVYHLVNLALVAGLADEGTTWWEDFTEEFWFYTISTLAVLALSPLIAIASIAYPQSWTLLPLLLIPLLAVQKAAEMSRQQEHRALHDPLTGLPNRLLLTDRIEQALARAERGGGGVVVMFLDLDLFKVVNDSLGHHAGDELLVDVAHRLQGAIRSGDTLARFGGDEFVVVCEDVLAMEGSGLAHRIADALCEPFSSSHQPVTVSASIGVAVANPSSTAHTLLRNADIAMYRAKERGRNQVVIFDEVMHQEADERLQDSLGLRRALDDHEFRLTYQPILDTRTGATVGLEALVRWQDPNRGLLNPDAFIAAAEETGHIAAIGRWVLDTALADVQAWRTQIPQASKVWLAVNISSRQLLAPDLVQEVSRSLAASGMDASAVHLEITESAIMSDLQSVLSRLKALRALGLNLAIDDFGTGYSSLAYLKRLPVTSVKIDRAFISGLSTPDDRYDRAIVEAVVRMAKSLRLSVVAEGVEDAAQLQVLRSLGGDYAQGFLWSPPLTPEEVPHWLTSQAAQVPDEPRAVGP